jgi:hypothetical protein
MKMGWDRVLLGSGVFFVEGLCNYCKGFLRKKSLSSNESWGNCPLCEGGRKGWQRKLEMEEQSEAMTDPGALTTATGDG